MSKLKMRTVLVPFDFSEYARKALDRALEITGESADVHVLYVVPPVLHVVSLDIGAPIFPVTEEEQARQSLLELKKIFAEPRYKGLTIQTAIGDPGSEIVEYAQRVQADLIVMPSHGRTGIKHLLLGSVAERVLRLARCPVLVLK